jgi:hypothetical protein
VIGKAEELSSSSKQFAGPSLIVVNGALKQGLYFGSPQLAVDRTWPDAVQ